YRILPFQKNRRGKTQTRIWLGFVLVMGIYILIKRNFVEVIPFKPKVKKHYKNKS
ncbi:MAG: hypothetical protein UZ12_BCD005000759, partial [Bacteroidetes bacterium OLB12]